MSFGNANTTIEKLVGRDNYATWEFAIRIYLEHEGLHKCLEGKEEDPTKVSKAKTAIILSIDKTLYVHVRDAKTAKDVWDTLKKTFDDAGLSRKIGLLRGLISVRLDSCASMELYVDEILSYSHKLNGVGFVVSDEMIGVFLLAGLPEVYRPMIMAIENSGQAITGDAIKTKLLQEVKANPSSSENAFFNKNRAYKNPHKNTHPHANKITHKTTQFRCYECNEFGHKSSECPRRSSTQKYGGQSGGHANGSSKNHHHHASKYTPTFSAVFLNGKYNKSDWFVDSGASSHMSMNRNWFHNISASKISEITTANNSRMNVVGVGDIEVSLMNDFGAQSISVKDVLYIPDLTANLLSVSCIVKNGNKVEFVLDGCRIYGRDGVLLASASLENNLYRLNATCNVQRAIATPKHNTCDIYTWHRRLGHVNYSDLAKMKNGAVMDLIYSGKDTQTNCEACMQGKQSRKPFNNVGSRANELLSVVHSDVCGPMETTSIGGARYVVVFIDDFSRMTFTYCVKAKSDVFDVFEHFRRLAENQTNRRIKVFRSDNGTEYCNGRFQALFSKCGIIQQTSTPYTPQQNGLAERTIRTITEKARCFLFDAGFGKEFWGEAVNAATYVKNRTSSAVLGDTSPIEVWSGVKPSVAHLRVFGCTAMVYVPNEKRLKLDAKSKKYRLVGYCEHTKGYRLIDMTNKRVIKSRDVEFFEKKPDIETTRVREAGVKMQFGGGGDGGCGDGVGGCGDGGSGDGVGGCGDGGSRDGVGGCGDGDGGDGGDAGGDGVAEGVGDDDEFGDAVDDSVIDPNYVPDDLPASNSNQLRRTARNTRPVERLTYSSNFSGQQEADADPMTVREAMQCSNAADWVAAMKSEYKSLLENNTWSLVQLPGNR